MGWGGEGNRARWQGWWCRRGMAGSQMGQGQWGSGGPDGRGGMGGRGKEQFIREVGAEVGCGRGPEVPDGGQPRPRSGSRGS